MTTELVPESKRPSIMDVGADDIARTRRVWTPEAYVLPGVLIGVALVLLALDAPTHIRELATWQSLGQSASIAIVVAAGLVIPLRAGEFNLGIGATVGASAIATAATFTTFDQPLWIAVLAGIVLGGLIGTTSGMLVARLGVNSLVTTLGLGIALEGIAEWLAPPSGYNMINATPLTALFTRNVPIIGMPLAIIIALMVAAATYVALEHLPFGRYLTAIGSNRTAATLVGIRVERTVLGAFAASGVIGGIAGVLVIGSFGSVSAQVMTGAGVTYWLPALASAYLGATAFHPGRFNVQGAVVAVVLVKLTRTLFTLARVSAAWPESLVNGAALVIAVMFSTHFVRRRAGR